MSYDVAAVESTTSDVSAGYTDDCTQGKIIFLIIVTSRSSAAQYLLTMQFVSPVVCHVRASSSTLKDRGKFKFDRQEVLR